MGRNKRYQNIEFINQDQARNLRQAAAESDAEAPRLARRRQNRRSTIRSGRTIGEQRERLETSSERQAAHQKAVRRKRRRIIFVTIGFILIAACPVGLYYLLVDQDTSPLFQPQPEITFEPTIEIVDTDAPISSSASGNSNDSSNSGDSGASGASANSNSSTSGITTRMKNYIGQAEVDFRDLGYTPEKAVIPSGSIREVDFYLKDQPGYVKMIIDRDTAPSVEDADRLIRYLKGQNINQFEYIDVRLEGKAYWK